MQSQSLTELLNHAEMFPAKSLMQVKSDMEPLAKKNAEVLADKEKPDYLRIPDAEELTNMRQYAVLLKKQNPKASKRQIRKGVQEKFNIKIYR